MRLIRILFYAAFLLAFLVAAVIFRARPQYQGELDRLDVQYDTEVLFDKYGIPHIYAESASDAYKALGYVHAQERLFQMELLRRAGGGRLSEILGPELLPVDKFFRTIGTHRKSYEEAKRVRAEGGEHLPYIDAYLEGVNAYVDQGRVPLEFKVLDIPRSHFSLSDMHCIASAMSFNFAQGLRTDPLLTFVKDNLGPEYLNSLAVRTPEWNENVPIHPKKELRLDSNDLLSARIPALKQYFELGLPTLYGSNTWVIAPTKTEDAVTLLANDTHIGYGQPCTWYEAHLEFPGHRIYGNFMGGIPFAIAGHNASIAWGVTMLLSDDMDLYCEELNKDSSAYLFKDEWRPLIHHSDTIQIKGEDPYILASAESHHGPMVSEFVQHTDSVEHISLSWTFLKRPLDLLEAVHGLNTAEEMADARSAVAKIAAPGLNISFADREGNIALWAAAHLPVRPEHCDPTFLLNGVTGDDEIIGYAPFDFNPSIENPPWGYVYSCNNQHESYGEGELYPGYYEPDDRATRVVQKLSARNDWSMEAMKRLIMDDHSQKHEGLSADLVAFLRNQRIQMNDIETEAFQQLREWEGRHHKEDVPPSIYYRWLYKILQGAMEDELGPEAFQEYLKTNVVKHSLSSMVCDAENPWWDDVRTERVEQQQDIIVTAFRTTVEKLTIDHGADVSQWMWGTTHSTTHPHAFKDVPLLGQWLSVGPFQSPGAIETINNSVFYLSDDAVIQAQYGPQMRRLIDMSDLENSLSVLPTGQSGMRMSPHYEDQAEMYISGSFRPQLMNRAKIERQSQTLLFKAAE